MTTITVLSPTVVHEPLTVVQGTNGRHFTTNKVDPDTLVRRATLGGWLVQRAGNVVRFVGRVEV